jgi:hypothetical protein
MVKFEEKKFEYYMSKKNIRAQMEDIAALKLNGMSLSTCNRCKLKDGAIKGIP